MNTPSVELAAVILERLAAEHLVLRNGPNKLLAKLAEGKLRPEDWRLEIELADEKGLAK